MSGDRNIHPGADGSMDLGFGPDPERTAADYAPSRSSGSSVTLTQEQFDALLSRAAPQEPAYDYAAAMGEPVYQQAPAEPQLDPIVNMIQSLPDPSRDFDGFKRGLGQVLADGRSMILQEAQGSAQTVSNVNRGFDDAWADFQKRYGDLAQYEDLVSDASSREMAELRQRGFDPNAVVLNNTEGFVDAVATRVANTVARVRGLEGQGDGDNPEDYTRTEMIGGGNPGRRLPERTRQNEGPTSLVEDLKKVQRELGIY